MFAEPVPIYSKIFHWDVFLNLGEHLGVISDENGKEESQWTIKVAMKSGFRRDIILKKYVTTKSKIWYIKLEREFAKH